MLRFPRFPRFIYIEPTNDCNLSCVMCPRETSVKTAGYMSFELYRSVVDQLSGRDIAQLSLHLAGEPLLHPRIAEMVAYAKGGGLRRVRFATNATLLNEDLARDLIEAGLDSLTVSMDSSIAARYCPGQKGDECLAGLDQNILRLIALRNKRGLESPELHMQMIQMESTQDLIDDFLRRWEGVADRVTIKPLLSWAGHIKLPTKPSAPVRGAQDRRRLSSEAYRNQAGSRLICVNHLVQGVVQWDGDVSFCCLYLDSRGDAGAIIGNAASASLEDIFLGERRKAMIEAQLRGIMTRFPTAMGVRIGTTI